MRAEIQLQTLHALDAGERTAEPYLWPMFFRIDEEVFAASLRAGREAGEIPDPAITDRGLDWALVDSVPSPRDWFVAPGGAHGNLPKMKSGETVELGQRFEGNMVVHHGLLRPAHAVIGCVALLWEEDMYPGDAKVEKAYASFAEATRARLETAVRSSINAQRGGHGPFEFGLPSAKFGARLNSDGSDKVDYVELKGKRVPEAVAVGRIPTATLQPEELERELSKRYRDRWDLPLIDGDDFIGAMFWAGTVGELKDVRRPQPRKKHWTPTTGSQEGSWALQFLATVTSGSER